MVNALVVLADGFEEIEALSVVDVLRRGHVRVTMAALGPDLTVTGTNGIKVVADASFAAVADQDFEAVVLPGGGPGTERLQASDELLERLQRQHAEGKLIAAICAAPRVLAKAGVLDEETHLTCYPTCAAELGRAVAEVPVVADGALITGQAPGSALLFALVLLKALAGESVATLVAKGMVSDLLD